MTEMLERVARAIMMARGGCKVTDWREAEWNPVVAQALTEARAAIAAIPTDDEAFLKAVGDRMHDGRFSVSGETYPVLRNFIRALQDTLLSEEKP
jgi:hypothetical protein